MIYLFFILILFQMCQVLYGSVLIIKHQPKPLSKKKEGFSIVIAAHNESHHLKNLLPALINQNYPDFEIIIVLDRCTDSSQHVISSFAASNVKVVEISEKPAAYDGKKHALTQGINQAVKGWILLTDADCLPLSEKWIDSFNNLIGHKTEIILGVSPYKKRPGLLNALITYETFQTAFLYVNAALVGKPYMGVGRNLAYKKSLFESKGGFREFKDVTGGDDDLFMQKCALGQNTRVVLKKESLTYSSAKRTITEYLTQKTRHLSVGKYYKTKLKYMLSFKAVMDSLLWLSFLYLAIFQPADVIMVTGMFCGMITLKALVFIKTGKKLAMPLSSYWFPVVDFLYAVFLPLIGIRSAFLKSIRWK